MSGDNGSKCARQASLGVRSAIPVSGPRLSDEGRNEFVERITYARTFTKGQKVKVPDGAIGIVKEIDLRTGSIRVKVKGRRESSYVSTVLTKL